MDRGYIEKWREGAESLSFCGEIYEGRWRDFVSRVEEGDTVYVLKASDIARSVIGLWKAIGWMKGSKVRLIIIEEGIDNMEFGFNEALYKLSEVEHHLIADKMSKAGRPRKEITSEEEAIMLSFKAGLASKEEIMREKGMSEREYEALRKRYERRGK